jgi:thiol:disulfide interchange protein
VTLALAVWIWGQFVQHGTRHRLLARVLSVLVLLLGYFFTLEKELRWRAPVAEAAVRGNLKESPDGIDWEPWSREAVQAARAAGRPVLVDFTADWCLTCQLNKRTSIEVPDVRKKLKELNAVALLGDYTRFDPAITEELKRFQRAGVPLVVVFPADPSGEPIVLPEALLPGIVLNALEKAAAPQVAARNKTGSG